jgi:CPA2 family monovalent cation:H+ antiporter-2
MPHDVSLIATIAAGFGLAMVFGLIASNLRVPALVGYLLAGQQAEIGVMLLMFGVGLHFSPQDLMAARDAQIRSYH